MVQTQLVISIISTLAVSGNDLDCSLLCLGQVIVLPTNVS